MKPTGIGQGVGAGADERPLVLVGAVVDDRRERLGEAVPGAAQRVVAPHRHAARPGSTTPPGASALRHISRNAVP